jgi:glutamyl-tRNA reductase
MQILALGLDHHRADVRLREQLQVPTGELPEVLGHLREQVAEGAILSTCNRTELYALVGHRDTGRRGAIRFLADARRVPTEAFVGTLTERWQEDAIRHLLRVSCGLESMIVGEHQILGQVRAAGDAARAAGSAGPILSRLFRDALTIGKRARVESGVARNAVSVSSAAVELAQKALGTLDGRTALVIGAGKMGSLAARSLLAKGVSRLLVISRTAERARMLAERVGGVPLSWDRLESGLAGSDLVIASTSAGDCVVTREVMGRALAGRREWPLVVVDIAVPRDVEPAVGELAGCTLYNIDDLAAVQQANLAARRLEAVKVEAMIEHEVDKFMGWWIGRKVAPTISELVARAEEIRLAEVERGLARLDLSERERNAVNAVTTAIVNKMLHRPIVALKERGGRHDANVYVHAVRELFGLPERD